MALARIDHRLDCERHSLLQLEPGTRLAVVQDLRVLVIHTADAVAAILAHDRVVALFDEGLNGVPDITEPGARFHRFDSAPHGFEAGLCQPLCVGRRFADEIHPAGIPVETIPDNGDVNVDDVASLEPFVIRYPVTHHVVHGRANGLGKTAVIQVCGNRSLHIDDVVVADAIEFLSSDAGYDVLADHVEHFCCQASGHAHFFLLFGGLYGHVHKFASEASPGRA